MITKFQLGTGRYDIDNLSSRTEELVKIIEGGELDVPNGKSVHLVSEVLAVSTMLNLYLNREDNEEDYDTSETQRSLSRLKVAIQERDKDNFMEEITPSNRSKGDDTMTTTSLADVSMNRELKKEGEQISEQISNQCKDTLLCDTSGCQLEDWDIEHHDFVSEFQAMIEGVDLTLQAEARDLLGSQ